MLPPPSKGGAVVVTGASSGIGEEFAREFARRGYQLVLEARRANRLRAIAESLGGKAHVLPVDLSSPVERATLPDQVAALGLVAEILVNNAGMSNLGPVAASDPQAELRSCTGHGRPGMRRGAQRRIGRRVRTGARSGDICGRQGIRSLVHRRHEGGAAPHGRNGGHAAVWASPTRRPRSRCQSFLWKEAKAGIDGLASGKRVIVPGAPNHVASVINHHLPRRLLLPMLPAITPG
ncbi:MAG: SDR family NAD(P)-dependent oxidoreductase [Mycobacterium sp.]